MTRRPMSVPPRQPNGGPPPARDSAARRPADPQAEAMQAVAAAIHDLADAVRGLKIVTEIKASLTLPGDE